MYSHRLNMITFLIYKISTNSVGVDRNRKCLQNGEELKRRLKHCQMRIEIGHTHCNKRLKMPRWCRDSLFTFNNTSSTILWLFICWRGEERAKELVRNGKVFATGRFCAVLPLNLCGKHIASDPQLLHRIQYLVSIQTIPYPCKWPIFWQFVCNTVYPADDKNKMKHPNEQRIEDARHYHFVWPIQVSTHKQKCPNVIGQLCSNFRLIEQFKVLRQFAYKIVHRFINSIPVQFIYTSCESPRDQFNCE